MTTPKNSTFHRDTEKIFKNIWKTIKTQFFYSREENGIGGSTVFNLGKAFIILFHF